MNESLADQLRTLVDDGIVARTTADGINVSRVAVRKIADQVQRVEEHAETDADRLEKANAKIAAAREALAELDGWPLHDGRVRRVLDEMLEALG